MHQKLLQVKYFYYCILNNKIVYLLQSIFLQNAEKILMKRVGQRGSGRPPIHCDIKVEILPKEENQVIILLLQISKIYSNTQYNIKHNNV